MAIQDEAMFTKDGHLTSDALTELCAGNLTELQRLEAAEHLAYCDVCLERYTALLTEDVLETPPVPCEKEVMHTLRMRTLRVVVSRYAVSAAAVALAFTLLGTNTFGHLTQVPRLFATPQPQAAVALQKPQQGVMSRLSDAIEQWRGSQANAAAQPNTNERGE